MTNNAKGQQCQITMKLGLQSTEVYFPYIAYVLFFFKEGVSYLKFMLIILKLRSFLFVFVGDGKLFLKLSLYMLLLQLSYISLFCFRE